MGLLMGVLIRLDARRKKFVLLQNTAHTLFGAALHNRFGKRRELGSLWGPPSPTPPPPLPLPSTRIEPQTSSDDLDGLIASRFELVRRLGDGAFAVVYEAIDLDLDRRVAIKLFTSFAPNELDSALREARAMARVRHPNVVMIHSLVTSISTGSGTL